MKLLVVAFTLFEPAAAGMLPARLVLCAAALTGLLMQHLFHHSDHDALPAPIAYAIGLSAAILPPHILLLALPLGAASAVALRNLGLGLVLVAFATAALGKLLGQSLFLVGTVSLLFFAPALFAGMFHRRLVLTVRRRAVSAAPLRDVRIASSAA